MHTAGGRHTVAGCDAISFCFELIAFPDEENENMSLGMEVQMPEDKSVVADFTINVPNAKYSRKSETLIYEKESCKLIKCFNHARILETKAKFIKNGYMNMVIEGTFKLIPRIAKPKVATEIGLPQPLATGRENGRIVSYLNSDKFDLLVDGQKIEVSL